MKLTPTKQTHLQRIQKRIFCILRAAGKNSSKRIYESSQTHLVHIYNARNASKRI
jgi:hypothetical protein